MSFTDLSDVVDTPLVHRHLARLTLVTLHSNHSIPTIQESCQIAQPAVGEVAAATICHNKKLYTGTQGMEFKNVPSLSMSKISERFILTLTVLMPSINQYLYECYDIIQLKSQTYNEYPIVQYVIVNLFWLQEKYNNKL